MLRDKPKTKINLTNPSTPVRTAHVSGTQPWWTIQPRAVLTIFLLISDRTDLSTESGSGPIQLARARSRTERRSVAESPPYCMTWPVWE